MKEKNIKNKDDSKKTAFVCSLFRTIKLLYCISGRYFIMSMIFTFLIGISSAMSVYATKILINALQSNISNSNSFFIMLIIYGLINISISVIQNLQNYISEKHRLFVDSQMDTICLEKCSHLEMGSWFGGNELSKGQWQRIAIARTIIRDSDVLVLDEPTSALDPIMEREIFRLIKAVSKQKILIFITHRISNLLEFDPYIFVMNSGKIVSQGNQGDLTEDIHFHRLLSGKDK